MRIAVVGGGIAGLAAARRLESLLPEADVVVVEGSDRLGGKLLTERVDGFLVEAAPDSFLARKQRGVGLCEEVGLGRDVVGRRAESPRSFVRRGKDLLPLPAGLTGMIPTDLDALAESPLLSAAGRARLAAEVGVPPRPDDDDESIAAFVSRRLGREAYDALVEPLMTGIYGGDGEQLSLLATFPNLRALELEHGSLLHGLAAHVPVAAGHPPFLSLRGGMGDLPTSLARSLARTSTLLGRAALAVRHGRSGYEVELSGGERLDTEAVVVATPAFAVPELFAELDSELAHAHAGIPYASSAVVTLGYRRGEIAHPLDGYGYVVPRAEGSEVLACTWSSSKWEGRAPEGHALIRVYLGRYGADDVTGRGDAELTTTARDELGLLDIDTTPILTRIHRWPSGMPQYVLGHPERLARIDAALERHPGLALAGAAYRGVGIPDCIASGEEAARAIARSLASVPG